MKYSHVPNIACGLLAAMAVNAPALAQQEPTREIVQVSGDLYRATNNNHHTVFLVTSEGIVLTDPINADFSRWLRAQLDERFGVPVKYVVYSHKDWDHASGGAVFGDTAVFVGHENMLAHLAMPPAGTPLPANMQAMDANRNGRIELAEAGENNAQFSNFDANHDGAIDGAEATRGPLAEVRVPDVVYSDRLGISLGGKQVELIYTGKMTHADDMTLVRFPAERAIFVVDWISPRRLPFRTLGTGLLDAWLNAIRFAETLDYDTVVGGHGAIGGKADVVAVRNYLEELRDAVGAGIAAGRSLEQIQASVTMDRYRDWINYEEWRPLNIEGMYNMLIQ